MIPVLSTTRVSDFEELTLRPQVELVERHDSGSKADAPHVRKLDLREVQVSGLWIEGETFDIAEASNEDRVSAVRCDAHDSPAQLFADIKITTRTELDVVGPVEPADRCRVAECRDGTVGR